MVPEIRKIFDNILKYRVDPAGSTYRITLQTLNEQLMALPVNNIVSIDSEYRYRRKGHMYDPILQSFVQGAGGQISTWAKEELTTTPVVLRGITKHKQMKACQATGRDFFYIDTGYFGNGKKKTFHRITRNDLQWFGGIIERPGDRLERTGVQLSKFKRGTNILIAPPSQKLLNNYDIILEDWLASVQQEIKKYKTKLFLIYFLSFV